MNITKEVFFFDVWKNMKHFCVAGSLSSKELLFTILIISVTCDTSSCHKNSLEKMSTFYIYKYMKFETHRIVQYRELYRCIYLVMIQFNIQVYRSVINLISDCHNHFAAPSFVIYYQISGNHEVFMDCQCIHADIYLKLSCTSDIPYCTDCYR